MSVTIELFDPPMCCPGGLCGPAIDPVLLDFNEAVIKLKKETGIAVERYLLSQQGKKFMENQEVLALLQQYSTEILPVTAVNGHVVKTKNFPTYEELEKWSVEPKSVTEGATA